MYHVLFQFLIILLRSIQILLKIINKFCLNSFQLPFYRSLDFWLKLEFDILRFRLCLQMLINIPMLIIGVI